MKITENTEIVKNTNYGKVRYHAKITGSKRMTKPYTKNHAVSICKDLQSDIDNGLIKSNK